MSFFVGPNPHKVGSSAGNHILLQYPSVSRNHAEVEAVEGGVWVADLSSKNGTRLNGRRLEPQGALAQVGDCVGFGAFRLWVEECESGDEPPEVFPDTPAEATPGEERRTVRWTPTSSQKDWFEVVAHFLSHLERGVHRSTTPALAALRDALGVSGAALVEFSASGELGLLACSPGADPESCQRSMHELCQNGAGFYTSSMATTYVEPNGEGRRGLILLGDFSRRKSSEPLLRVLLALCLGRAADGSVSVAEQGHADFELDFPEDYVVGTSVEMTQLYERMRPLARRGDTVLILGETGVGKELIARTLHRSSPRKGGPFVACNCAALQETLLEADLFGVQKGAFTGATTRPGYFQSADGGTLFLDEIGELPLKLQAKLLRVLQEGELVPVGTEASVKIDVRVLAATNLDLRDPRVREGKFRDDLFHRLDRGTVYVPPLKKRKTDIDLLAEALARRAYQETGKPYRGFTPVAMRQLLEHSWPGNVRELENVIRSLVDYSPSGQAIAGHTVREVLNPSFVESRPPDDTGEIPKQREGQVGPDRLEEARKLLEAWPPTLEDWECWLLARVWEETGHVQEQTAKLLGLSRKQVRNRLEKHGLLGEPASEGQDVPSGPGQKGRDVP